MRSSPWRIPVVLALVKLAMHLPFLARYGIHHDELYFIACGRHFASGYVDHAPLVPWIARLADDVLPGSLFALRLPAVLAGSTAVFMTGLLTGRLGGGPFAQLLAGLSFLAAPVYQRTGSMLTIPSFEPLIWILGSYFLVRILEEDKPALWLNVGLVSGIGLLTKHSTLFFGLGLIAGLVLTPGRSQLRSRWLYAGGAIAALFVLPNLLWQVEKDWPTLTFLRGLRETTLGSISPAQFVLGQLLYLNPATAPVWLLGLGFLFKRAGVAGRLLGWIYVTAFALLALVGSKIYYLAPAYPALLAGGGVAWERLTEGGERRWRRPAIIAALTLFGLLLAPIGIPILSLDLTERYVEGATFGALDNVYELTGDLRGQFGWRERAEVVGQVYRGLAPEERERSVIFGSWYGVASAIDYFGPSLGLPKAVSGHMTYYLWGLPSGAIDTVIAAGVPPGDVENWKKLFGEVSIAADVELENVNPWEKRFLVLLCRQPKLGVREIWSQARRW